MPHIKRFKCHEYEHIYLLQSRNDYLGRVFRLILGPEIILVEQDREQKGARIGLVEVAEVSEFALRALRVFFARGDRFAEVANLPEDWRCERVRGGHSGMNFERRDPCLDGGEAARTSQAGTDTRHPTQVKHLVDPLHISL